MSAPTTTTPRTKPCESSTCDNLIVERPRAARAEFDGKRFCSRSCSTHVRVAAAAAKKKADAAIRRRVGSLSTAKPFVPRIEGGVWRPNAPGWPAAPMVPARLAGEAR